MPVPQTQVILKFPDISTLEWNFREGKQ